MIKKNLEILFTPPKKCFSILSSNIQGIGAKFDELKTFVEEIREKYNFEFSAIYLQECQFKETDKTILSKFKFDNYNILPQGQSR